MPVMERGAWWRRLSGRHPAASQVWSHSGSGGSGRDDKRCGRGISNRFRGPGGQAHDREEDQQDPRGGGEKLVVSLPVAT